MKKSFSFVMMIVISLVFFAGCVAELVVPENDVNSPASEGNSNPAGGSGIGKGTLKLYLTDAPGDFKELNIVVSRIDGHISVEGEEEEGYWETLKEWPEGLQVDLLTLQGVSLLLGSIDLPANHYTQLRVFLKEEAELVLEGNDGPEGSTVTEILTIPSSANTGIKLNRPFDIVEGGITKLTLDFDAEKSIIKTGNGKYKMKPVITVLSENYSSEELPELFGSVSGNVSYYESIASTLTGLGGANIKLTGITYIFTKTTTSLAESLPEVSEGDFELLDIPAGTYTLNVSAEGYSNYSEEIEVVAEADTPVDVVLLAEEPGGILGSVIDSGTAEIIEGAAVNVELESLIYIFNGFVETDGAGSFLIEQLPVGSYRVTVSAEGYDEYNATGLVVLAGLPYLDLGVIELSLTEPDPTPQP